MNVSCDAVMVILVNILKPLFSQIYVEQRGGLFKLGSINPEKGDFLMKWMKKLILTICMAVLLGCPFFSYADEPQTQELNQQQSIASPTDQSADQQMLPAVPAPQEEEQNQDTGK